MRHASVFSGIGGFELAAHWCGWENVFHCEKNKFGRRVLKYYWENSISYEDIRYTDFTIHRGEIDVFTGGFPCQKYSIAGSKVGDEPLKKEMLRAFDEIEPCYGVFENVGNFIGKKFSSEHDELCLWLENKGYSTVTLDLDAASFGLPTLERHIWVIATSNSIRPERSQQEKIPRVKTLQREFSGGYSRIPKRWELPKSRVCELGKGFSYKLYGTTVSKWHGDALEAIGNAIPPEIAYRIFKVINQL